MEQRMGTLAKLLLLGAGLGLSGSVAAPERLTAQTNRPAFSMFAPGEAVVIDFAASGLVPLSAQSLRIAVHDAAGAAVAEETEAGRADAAGLAHFRFAAPSPRLGYFEVRAGLGDGTGIAGEGSRPGGVVSYAVVSDPAQRVDYGPQLSRFGLQGGFNSAAAVLPWLGARRVLGAGDWAALEPDHAGQFAAARRTAEARGRRWPEPVAAVENQALGPARWQTYPVAFITRATIPDWARSPGTNGSTCARFGALNPAGAAGLGPFAGAFAESFAHDFPAGPRVYQVTWEPGEKWCFGGDPAGLVAFYSATYAALHRADRAALVAGPTLFLDPASSRQLDGLWAAGLGRWLDVLALHPYVNPGPPERILPALLRGQLAAANRAAGRRLPFIGTEHGFDEGQTNGDGDGSPALVKAQWDIRTTLIMLGEGAWFDFGFYVHDFGAGGIGGKIQRFGYFWNLDPALRFGPPRLGPKPMAAAYAAMTWLLDGSTSAGPLPGLAGSQRGYRFKRGGRITAAAWDPAGRSVLAVPGGTTLCDWFGNCAPWRAATVALSPQPVYLRFK